jgi:hypothetical protein
MKNTVISIPHINICLYKINISLSQEKNKIENKNKLIVFKKLLNFE